MLGVNVVLYGADWCIHCNNAKNWLDEKKIAYEFRNVDDSTNKDYLTGLNVRGIPFFQVKKEGKQDVLIRGFNKEQLISAMQ